MDAIQKWIDKAVNLAFMAEINGSSYLDDHLRTTPEGYMLVKRCAQEDRSWPEDSSHENGAYFNTCISCERQFTGHKRRIVCKACAIPKAPPPKSESL